MPSGRHESIAAQPSQYKAGIPLGTHREGSGRILKEYEKSIIPLATHLMYILVDASSR